MADLTVPEPPPKGSDWATWTRWVLTLVTVIVSAVSVWQGVQTDVKKQKEEVKKELRAEFTK